MIPALAPIRPVAAFLGRHWYLVVIAGLAASCGLQTHRLNSVEADLAEEKQARAEETLARERAANSHKAELQALKDTHRAQVKEKEDAFAIDKAALRTTAARHAADGERLRDKLTAATRRSPADQTGPAACQRDGDRLEALGPLAGEGIGLVAEARGLLDQRDLEVKRLLDQIKADRAACSPGS